MTPRLLATLGTIALAAPATAQLRVEKAADLTHPVTLAPGQGAIVIGFRRPNAFSLGKSGVVAFARYDAAARDLVFQPKGAKKSGDTTTYWAQARSADKKAAHEVMVLLVSAGDFVLYGATPGAFPAPQNTYCFGAPTFHVGAGEVVYFGDVTPYTSVKLVDGSSVAAMAYSSHADDARAALAKQPVLLGAFKVAELRNGASFGCLGQAMGSYRVPGAPEVAPALVQPTR